MSLELAFARDFVAWGNGHPRGAILWPGCAPGEERRVEWSWGLLPKSRVFREFVTRRWRKNEAAFNHSTITVTYRCHRPPNTKYQSGEGSGGGGFFSASTSSAYGSQIARAYDGT